MARLVVTLPDGTEHVQTGDNSGKTECGEEIPYGAAWREADADWAECHEKPKAKAKEK